MKVSESMPTSTASTAYEKIEGAKAKKLIERLNKSWRGSPFDAEKTVVHARSLPFLENWVLAEASDATSLPEKKCALLDNGKNSLPIEFNTAFITGFAAKEGIYLDRDTAPDYLRFWFEYARGGAERFILVESLDEMPWREEATPQARKSLAKSITPLTLVSTGPDAFSFKACVLFKDALFECTLTLSAKGDVKTVTRALIADNLTVIDPLTGF